MTPEQERARDACRRLVERLSRRHHPTLVAAFFDCLQSAAWASFPYASNDAEILRHLEERPAYWQELDDLILAVEAIAEKYGL
ncbi:MAG: hypothetical protein FJ027_24020 [Candidatus Rokubacteria bacterium]|nr:hypothetical protein [Candidatus Rokubacteria bacterium]